MLFLDNPLEKMQGRIVLVCVIVCVLAFPSNVVSRTYTIYETTDKIQDDGYPAEIHHVTTDDGYILEMHRIPSGRRFQVNSPDRPVVFLMHGLLAASNCFVFTGPDHSVAYNLADAGFDVWMGNARGNKNSRYHVTLDPDDDREKFDFFDFTWEEIAMYDVAAMVDYVLEFTGREKLHYIGHSQGGTVFLVLASMRPEYNEKFMSVHLMAGVGYMEYFPNEELVSLAAMTDMIYGAARLMGIAELFPGNSTELIPGLSLDDLGISSDSQSSHKMADYCTGNLETQYFCELTGMRHILRDDVSDGIHKDPLEDYAPGGAALKQIAHYGQNIRDKQFRRYSHGVFSNLAAYGSFNPPLYDLTLITANLTMHYSLNDTMLDERDVLSMAELMPNTVVRKVARESFTHEDFIAADDARELVTDYVIEAIMTVSGWSGPPIVEVVPATDYPQNLINTEYSTTTISSAVVQPDTVIGSAIPVADSAPQLLCGVSLIITSLVIFLT